MFCCRQLSKTSLIALALLVVTAKRSTALEPGTTLSHLTRQSWTMESGLPQNTVSVLLQASDGYLWAGTELGLARFDGIAFRVFDHAANAQFPDAEIRALLHSHTAGPYAQSSVLWIGTGDGIVRLENGHQTLFTTREGLPSNSIRGLAETSNGHIWAWTEAGLAQWDGQHFRAMPLDGLSKASANLSITSIATDDTGGFWIGTVSGAAVFRKGKGWVGFTVPSRGSASQQIQPFAHGKSLVASTPVGDVLVSTDSGVYRTHGAEVSLVIDKQSLMSDEVAALSLLSDGRIAIASKSAVVIAGTIGQMNPPLHQFAVGAQLPGSRIEVSYADREGSLWVGTNRGLARITADHANESVQLFPPTDPLAVDAIASLVEDREGDIWVGTESAGLHILRDTRFQNVGTSQGLSSDATTAIVQDKRGAMWIGTRDSGLNRIENGKATLLTTKNGLLSNIILSLAGDPDGGLWVGTPDGLNQLSNDKTAKIRSFTSADGLPDDFIRSLLVSPDKSIWVGTRRGLTHLDHGQFETLTQGEGLGSDLIGAIVRTPNGDLWVATLNGLSRIHDGHIRNFTTVDGLSSNVITALDVDLDGKLWIGTQSNGVDVYDGVNFRFVQDEKLPHTIHAVQHDDQGHLWFASENGLTRADQKGLFECAEKGDCANAHVSHFTTADGLRSRETSINSHPTTSRTHDGQLWFTTPHGVIEVDPKRFPSSPPPPPVVIERIASDDRDLDVGSLQPIRITAGYLRLQIDYIGLSFAAGQKLRYQYMLEGFDHGWTDAGTRRTAYYTNLPPHQYRFRVRAAFSESDFTDLRAGTPDPAEADLAFELMPRFYQTIWFRVLAIVGLAALILALLRYRVLRVERGFSVVMAERNRIAREIHDTLAQGYVAISLQLEVLGELLRLDRPEAAAKHLAVTQTLVREGLDDARQSIWALRSQDANEQTLPIRIRRLVEQTQGEDLVSELEVHGAYRAYGGEVEQEIVRIIQEALQNVRKHASAQKVLVRLDYDHNAFALAISDDGKGFETSRVGEPKNGDTGHYGLTGMRERALLIHAELEIDSKAGRGTTVRLRLAPDGKASQSRNAQPEVSPMSHENSSKESL